MHPTNVRSATPHEQGRRALVAIVGVGAALGLLMANSTAFLPHQSVWVDETTQIRGLSLGPRGVVSWLMGHGPDLGVPGDRMPPLSYLIGMAWSSVAGSSPASLRLLGVTCTAVGVTFAAAAAFAAYGGAAAVIAAAFLVVSPNVTVYSVEIRAYPIFFLFASLATFALVNATRTGGSSRTRWIGLLGVALVVATLTHFFGLLLAGGCVLALLWDARRRAQTLLPVLVVCAVMLLAGVAILPFAMAAVGLSPGITNESRSNVSDVLRLVYRQFGHPALASHPVATALATAGFVIAIWVAWLERRSSGGTGTVLFVALGSGLFVAMAASMVATKLSTTAPHYNVWTLPIVSVLLSSVSRASSRWSRRIGIAGAGILLTGTGIAAAELRRNPDAYAHGPQRQIATLVAELGSDDVLVVHDDDSEAAGHLFFPLRVAFEGKLPQYRFSSSGLVPFDPKDAFPEQERRTYALVVRTRHTPAAELARLLAGPAAQAGPSGSALRLERSGWERVGRHVYVAQVRADVEVLRRMK